MKKRKDNVNLYNWVHHQQKKQNYSSIVNFIEHITGTTVEKGRPGPDVFNSAVYAVQLYSTYILLYIFFTSCSH